MKITIGGLPGSGTSTVARQLARKLKLQHIDAGDIWDEMAAARNTDVTGLNLLGESDPSIDKELDERMLGYAKTKDNVILEGRIIGWLSHQNDLDNFKIWFDCPLETRIQRVKKREGVDMAEIKDDTKTRENSEAKRYKEYYNIDIADHSIYDLVVDSSVKTPPEIVEFVLHKLEQADGHHSRVWEKAGNQKNPPH